MVKNYNEGSRPLVERRDAYLVRSNMEVLPEEQQELADDEREEKNEHHFHVHCLVSLVLLVDRFMSNSEAFLRAEFVELERLGTIGSFVRSAWRQS